jgi:hypothetical protein
MLKKIYLTKKKIAAYMGSHVIMNRLCSAIITRHFKLDHQMCLSRLFKTAHQSEIEVNIERKRHLNPLYAIQ